MSCQQGRQSARSKCDGSAFGKAGRLVVRRRIGPQVVVAQAERQRQPADRPLILDEQPQARPHLPVVDARRDELGERRRQRRC